MSTETAPRTTTLPDLKALMPSNPEVTPPPLEALNLNVTKPLGPQIEADALKRARPTLEGLEWKQYGRRYKVTDYDLLVATRKEVSYSMGRNEMGLLGLKNKKTVRKVPDLVPLYTVTIYDEKNEIVGTTSWKRDELYKYFDKDHQREEKDRMTDFGWHAAPDKSKPKPVETIPVHLRADETPIQTILRKRNRLGLEGLQGLRLQVNGEEEIEEVVDQFIVTHAEYGHAASSVAWVTKVRDRHGNTVRRNTYIDDALPKHLANLAKQHTSNLIVSFVVPSERPEATPETVDDFAGLTDEERAWAGWLAVQPPKEEEQLALFEGDGPEAPRGPELTLDHIYAFFASADVYADKVVVDIIETYKTDPKHEKTRQLAETLVRTAKEIGSERVLKLAKKMRDEYLRDMRLLDLHKRDHPIPGEDLSLGWALRGLAAERLYDKEQYEKDGSLATYEGINPFRDTPTARQRQGAIIAQRVGTACEEALVHYTLQPVIEDGEMLRNKEGKIITKRVLATTKKEIVNPDKTPGSALVVDYDKKAFERLPKLIKDEVLDIIQRGKRNEAEQLIFSERTRLGLLLRKGLGQ